MHPNTKQKINVATILVLALMAACISPRAMIQAMVFIALLAVVFGREFVLKKSGILK
ncbi:MAG TPA: hypothetical protein VN761_13445 [Candidatus Polarisedimenticolia bacterium]|nr:hypothetical protein [Candidatus Polarisedimenticolia bacterium]